MTTGQLLFNIASGFYGLGLIGAHFLWRRQRMALLFLVLAMLANAAVIIWRYWVAWPMLPMYLGPVALPLFLVGLFVFQRHALSYHVRARNTALTLLVILSLAAVVFPKDYYIPFIKSQTVWAHLFFWLGTAGKGCFLMAAAWAVEGVVGRSKEAERAKKREREKRRNGETERKMPSTSSPCPPVPPSPRHPLFPAARSTQWIVWGFAFWTLSMFTGEMWSYLGWGTPVVWDDPAITTTMATWFFYICLLHLHLTGTWSRRGRCAYAAGGAVVVLVLNVAPELGPLRWLW